MLSLGRFTVEGVHKFYDTLRTMVQEHIFGSSGKKMYGTVKSADLIIASVKYEVVS
jgi:hypothetical protein